MAVDPHDDTLWLITASGQLIHFDAQGSLTARYTLPGGAQDLAVGQDQSVWVIAAEKVWHYQPDGELLDALDLSPWLAASPERIALDSLAGQVWIASREQVVRFDRAHADAPNVQFTGPRAIAGILVEPKSGALWVLSAGTLIKYDRDGTPLASHDAQLAAISAFALDSTDGTIWLGHREGLERLSSSGARLSSPAVRMSVREVAAKPFQIAPELHLIYPSDGTFSGGDVRPTFVFGFGARCNDAPCGLPLGYAERITVSGELDRRDISDDITLNPLAGLVTFTPNEPLSQESRALSIVATDMFGHASNRVTVNLAAGNRASPAAAGVLAKKPNQPPAVSMTAPLNGATFLPGSNITVSATATDSDGTVAQVDFYRAGVTSPIGTDTTSPYSIVWSNVAAGTYALTAKATDNLGATTTSSTVNITVAPPPNSPPTVAITSPLAGANVTPQTSLTISASASDSDGTIAKVDFYQGANLLGTATTAPYTFTWASVPAGSHNLTAVATDNLGAATTSAAVGITAAFAPLVVLFEPANCTVVQGPTNVLLRASAVDPDGAIVRVDFYQGSTLIGTSSFSAANGYGAFTWTNVPLGTYTLTAKATDNAGLQTTSPPITLIVAPPNVLPTVSLTAPLDGTTYGAPANITLVASASDSDGTITKVDFYNFATLLGTATNSPYTLTLSNAPASTYRITAKATDNLGGTATSVARNIYVVPNDPPSVNLTEPAFGAVFYAPATVRISATATDNDSVARVDFYANGAPIGTATSAPYTLYWNASVAGNYTLTAIATDNLGATSTNSNFINIVVNGVSFSVSSPANGATITDNNVLISGAVVAPQNAGITVNGQIAAYDRSGHFYAVVPLSPGANSLQINLATETGQTASQTLSLTSSGVQPGLFTVDAAYGFASLPVTFTLQVQSGLNYQAAEFDLDGSGNFATVFQRSALSYPTFTVTNTYTQAGVYVVRVRLRDDSGVIVYQGNQVIQVVTQTILDALARGVWSQMNSALVAGDTSQATTFLTDPAKANYGDAFTALSGSFGAIVSTYSAPQTMATNLDSARLTVRRTISGRNRVFVIQFILDSDGVWRLDAM